ncbi:thiolase family protein [Cryobacterium luteum]|uniref:Thiolase family protein n=1 Tax=Cryobacterium luteum TaxID=1424661 RepID=A0A1H8LZ05_9MICO|nr:thiolase family protein [Cryobacterium luteum]TFB85224.1 thiolase family protein [Cryobacterium luteum]SEO10337.1 acetyl-CoA acyltransferase [Cryobacterium luteum]
MENVFIIDALRLASGRGKAGGALSSYHPVELLADVIRPLVARNDFDPAAIDDVIIGCLAQLGEQGLNIARNAALAAGLPVTVPGTTVDRQCGSSLQAASFAAAGIAAGIYDIVIAGGVEMMSKFPINYATLGQDPFGPSIRERFEGGLVGQGISAELVAARWGLDRATIDAFAARSHRLAAQAADQGLFDREIQPVIVTRADGSTAVHNRDETIRATTTIEGLGGLKTAFDSEVYARRFPEIDWQITPGNASPLTDGASAVLLASAAKAAERGLRPRARFVEVAVVGSDPIEMLTGVIPATQRVLARSGLSIDDIDAYEVNEAFAPVPLAWLQTIGANPDKLNQRGGAIALGHALGSTGTRLITTLLNVLEDTGGRYGLIAICEGQGMANAAIIERIPS